MIKPYLDGINIDLKAFRNDFYAKRCQAKLQPVLKNIRRVYEAGIWMEITTLVIPEENDSEEELSQIAEFISGINRGIPWHVSAFYPDYRMLEKEPTPLETLQRAYRIGKKAGLKYVYMGNILNGKESAYCPFCGELLISRYGYQTKVTNLKEGRCGKCNERIEGVWN
jgi:pyruvate formate lyase activating enzyme